MSESEFTHTHLLLAPPLTPSLRIQHLKDCPSPSQRGSSASQIGASPTQFGMSPS